MGPPPRTTRRLWRRLAGRLLWFAWIRAFPDGDAPLAIGRALLYRAGRWIEWEEQRVAAILGRSPYGS